MPSTWLNSTRRTVTSQNGEDGVLEAIFSVIGTTNKWCCEFGAWDGKLYSNCYNLFHFSGWHAVLIEGDERRARSLAENQSELGDVIPIRALVRASGPDSLDNVLAQTVIPEEFELLSIDIDNDDYHVWAGMKKYHPRVVVIEVNSQYSRDVIKIPVPGYDRFTLKSGASLRAMVELGKSLGYELALHTGNGIFIRRDLADLLDIDRDNWKDLFDPSWTGTTNLMKMRVGLGDLVRSVCGQRFSQVRRLVRGA